MLKVKLKVNGSKGENTNAYFLSCPWGGDAFLVGALFLFLFFLKRCKPLPRVLINWKIFSTHRQVRPNSFTCTSMVVQWFALWPHSKKVWFDGQIFVIHIAFSLCQVESRNLLCCSCLDAVTQFELRPICTSTVTWAIGCLGGRNSPVCVESEEWCWQFHTCHVEPWHVFKCHLLNDNYCRWMERLIGII